MTNFDQDQDTLVVIAAPPVLALSRVPAALPLLPRLLKIANTYQAEGSLRQAMDIYFELVEKHPETLEGCMARDILLQIGEQFERESELHQARSLYERLL